MFQELHTSLSVDYSNFICPVCSDFSSFSNTAVKPVTVLPYVHITCDKASGYQLLLTEAGNMKPETDFVTPYT